MVDQVELVERVARALCAANFKQQGAEGEFGTVDDCWFAWTDEARTALEASHCAELVEAAATVFASAERPGSRAEYAIGPNGEETWHDYQEVSQPALDKLATVLAKVRTASVSTVPASIPNAERDDPKRHLPLSSEEKFAAFIIYIRALETAGLSPGYGRILRDEGAGVDFAFGLPNFMIRNAILTAPETVAEAADILAQNAAIATEARRAETSSGSVHEGEGS